MAHTTHRMAKFHAPASMPPYQRSRGSLVAAALFCLARSGPAWSKQMLDGATTGSACPALRKTHMRDHLRESGQRTGTRRFVPAIRPVALLRAILLCLQGLILPVRPLVLAREH